MDISKETIYKTATVEFGDLFGYEASEATISFREPKTRTLLSYQKMLSKILNSHMKEFKELSESDIEKMTEEELLAHSGDKLGAIQDLQEAQYDWLYDHFSEVFYDTNVFDGEKKASADKLRDLVFERDVLTLRVMNTLNPMLARK